jgi:hypothetical protein
MRLLTAVIAIVLCHVQRRAFGAPTQAYYAHSDGTFRDNNGIENAAYRMLNDPRAWLAAGFVTWVGGTAAALGVSELYSAWRRGRLLPRRRYPWDALPRDTREWVYRTAELSARDRYILGANELRRAALADDKKHGESGFQHHEHCMTRLVGDSFPNSVAYFFYVFLIGVFVAKARCASSQFELPLSMCLALSSHPPSNALHLSLTTSRQFHV